MSRTFDSGIIPLLGFFLLRWTPLMDNAVWDWRTGHHVVDFEWFSVCLPFLLDHSPMTKLGTAVRRLADELAAARSAPTLPRPRSGDGSTRSRSGASKACLGRQPRRSRGDECSLES
jgi:hypothetical protein